MTPRPNPSSRIEGGEELTIGAVVAVPGYTGRRFRILAIDGGFAWLRDDQSDGSPIQWSLHGLTLLERALPPSFVGQDLTVSRDLGQAVGGPEPVQFSFAIETRRVVRVRMRFPHDIEAWADGTSAVTEGPKLQRYDQMYAERKRVIALFEAALAPVIADAHRVMEDVRAIIEAASPSAPNDRTRETPKNDPREEQSDAGEGA